MNAQHAQHDISDLIFPVINGTIAPSNRLAPVLAHRFEVPWKQGIVASDSLPNEGVKEYLAVSDFTKVIDTIAHNDSIGHIDDAHLYEIIPEHRPVRPYFDLEWDTAQRDEETVLSLLIPIIFHCLHQAGFRGCNGIALYTASGASRSTPSGKKSSFHLLFDMHEAFLNVSHHKLFIQNILLPAIKKEPELYWNDAKNFPKLVLDKAPYGKNQAFRLPQQSKYVTGISRPLVLYDCETLGYRHAEVYTAGIYEDPSTLTMIRMATVNKPMVSLITTAGTESVEFPKVAELCACLNPEFLQDYESTRNLIWMLWALEQTERMRTLIHSVCQRGNNYRWKWVEDIVKGFKFGGLTVGSLVKWAREAAGDAAVNKIIAKYKDVYYQELFQTTMKPTQHRVLNERYLGPVAFEGNDTMLILSHLGTGKTHSITRLIAYGDYERILIISPRKSYTAAQVGEFEAESSLPFLQSYMDHSGPLYHIDYLILQVESLHRIGEWFKPYDLVIMDESESILNQLHSTMTNGDNLINNHQVLELAVKTAKRVIFADAFMTDRTFHFAKALRDPLKTLFIENEFQPYAREAILLKKDGVDVHLEGFCERILAALRAGRRVVVVWTSKRVGEEFEERLKKEEIPYLFYHSDVTKEEHLGLKNVEESWKGVKCLMMTTSITVGISYDPRIEELEYDEAFLYGSSTTALPRDIAQSLLRVRVLKANRLTYVTNIPAYAVEECGFTNVCNMLTAKEEHLTNEHPLIKWVRCPSWARWNHAYNENERRCSCTYYKAVLEKYLVNSGYTLRVEMDEVKEEKEEKEEKEAIVTEEVEEEKCGVDYENIADITYEHAKEIQQAIYKGEADRSDKWLYQKFAFRGQFEDSVGYSALKGFWEKFVMTREMEKFWNVALEKRMSFEDMVRRDARFRFAPMAATRIKRREAMRRFMGIIGLAHSQQEATLSHEMLVEMGAALCAEEVELRTGMGLRASQRKGEWKMGNTIDLIRVMLEEWGGGTVRSAVKYVKRNKVSCKEFTLYLNENNTFWDSIRNYNGKLDDFLINV